jgi:hypothetical protein
LYWYLLLSSVGLFRYALGLRFTPASRRSPESRSCAWRQTHNTYSTKN